MPRSSPDAAPRAAVAAEYRWLSAQVALLRWAGLWYVLPLGAGMVGMALARPEASLLYLAVVGVFAAALVWINVRASVGLAETRDRFAALLRAFDAPV